MNAHRKTILGIAALLASVSGGAACAADATWESKVVKLVAENYTYPRSAVVRQEQGRAVVKIVIAPSGKPVSVELIQSSGSQILDREAVRIPLKVAAYPAPPGGTNTTVSVPINWRIS